MSIQPSVLIWTVISFFVLYFVLKKFLFTPILEVMDKREEKINTAKSARQTIQAEKALKKAEAESALIEAQKNAMAENEAALEKAREESAKKIALARADYNAKLDEMRDDLALQSSKMQSELEGEVGELALAYANMLIF